MNVQAIPPLTTPSVDVELRKTSSGLMTPMRWLVIAIAAFIAVSFTLAWLRAIEFHATTWDLGVYQQALWTTAHGRPFYETADVETGGFGSLLQIHSVFLFYGLVPLYWAFPYPTTLFAVQSVVVGVAAIPLFLLARDLTGSSRLGLVAGIVYLTWTPVLSSALYDVHPEAFLPVEIFTLILLWERHRYGWGFVVAAIAFSTMEVAPVLTFFVGGFGLLDIFGRTRRAEAGVSTKGGWNLLIGKIRGWLSDPRVRASLTLMTLSVAAFALLLYLRVDVLTRVLGTYPLSVPANGYVIGGTPAGLQLSWANASVGLVPKLEYWLTVVALLGFLPLFAPRALVLSVPWFAFTLFSADQNYVTLGFQYGFIVASSLMVAFAYGLPNARRLVRWLDARARGRRTTGPLMGAAASRSWKLGHGHRALLAAGLAGLVAVNLALSPLNPMMDGRVAYGAGYQLSYHPNPNDGQVVKLASLIPPGSDVIASYNLFPLVANDANAYSFAPVQSPELGLPFGPAHPPKYVLISQDSRDAVSGWLPSLLYNSVVYGVRGVVWSSDPGVVLLFEAGYSGAPTQFGALPDPSGTYYGESMVYPTSAFVATAASSAFSSVVSSDPGALGTVWFGPGANVAPGNFDVRLSLRATVLPGASPPAPNTTVVAVGAEAWGTTLTAEMLTFGAVQSSGWTFVNFFVTVPEPTIEFGVVGVALDSSVQVTLNYVSLTPEGPGQEGHP